MRRAEDLIIEDAVSPNILKKLRGGAEGLARVIRSSYADIGSMQAPHGYRSPYWNFITVAKQGGDFQSVTEALIAIEDNSDLSRYCIFVYPGLYDEQVVMKPYVALVGLDRDVCIIQSSDYDRLLTMASHSSLNELQIINTATAMTHSQVVYALNRADILIDSCILRQQGCYAPGHTSALLIDGCTDIRLLGTEFYSDNSVGGGATYGILSDSGQIELRDCYIEIPAGSNAWNAAGILLWGASDGMNASIIGTKVIVDNDATRQYGICLMSVTYGVIAEVKASTIEHRSSNGGGWDLDAEGAESIIYVRAARYSTWNTIGGGQIIPLAGDRPSWSTRDITIAGDAITVSAADQTIMLDTEGGAASDNLATINGGAEGQIIILRSAAGARDIVVKDGTGNIQCGADFTLDTIRDRIMLHRRAAEWECLSKQTN